MRRIVLVLALIVVALPFGSKAAGVEVCNTDPAPKGPTSFCVIYDFATASAVPSQPTDVDVSIDNSSTNFPADKNFWISTIAIDVLDSSGPSAVTPTAAMPDDLLIAGGDMDCTSGTAFATCDAGKGTIALTVTGSGIFDGAYTGTFGIKKITNAQPADPGAIARYEVESEACATFPIVGFQCGSATSFASVIDTGGIARFTMPGTASFPLPLGTADATFDTLSVHLDGTSSTLGNGAATTPTTIIRNPDACTASGTGTFTSRAMVTLSSPVNVQLNCTTNTVNASGKKKVTVRGVIGHADLTPLTPGTPVKVELFVKKRGFKLKKTAQVPIDALGNYTTTMKQGRAAKKCRVVSTFPGDANHGSSTATRTFKC